MTHILEEELAVVRAELRFLAAALRERAIPPVCCCRARPDGSQSALTDTTACGLCDGCPDRRAKQLAAEQS